MQRLSALLAFWAQALWQNVLVLVAIAILCDKMQILLTTYLPRTMFSSDILLLSKIHIGQEG